VLDTMLTCPRDARIFQGEAALVVAAADAPLGLFKDIPVERIPRAAGGGLDLDALMQNLTAREINEVLLECGPTLAGAFAAKQLVDEFVIYVAPKLLGCDAAPLMRIQSGGDWLPAFEFRDAQPFGEDLRIILRPKKP
jgi:diaminohydroxyphosphoribosylaminopyrimidine deaminase/5-amino-6-(5-phosphoribosylamino)uracil reductase